MIEPGNEQPVSPLYSESAAVTVTVLILMSLCGGAYALLSLVMGW